MQIREALETDIPEIVSVLKKSLGEADLPLSAEIWKYKHLDNPFGKSLVLVAVEDGKIAGVRAFMRWKWRKAEKEYSAFRAVDTATHPDYQGKGIFKKLTLRAVEMGVNANHHFVFNTPNGKSRPGYLKMGWKEVGKLKVGLKPAWNSFFKINSQFPDYKNVSLSSNQQLEDLCRGWNENLETSNLNFTPKKANYLKWRYENNILQKYEVYNTSDFYLACYVKKRKNFKELRIAECIFRDKDKFSEIKKIIRNICSKFGVQVISFSPELLIHSGFSIKGNFGPVLTVRNLNLSQEDILNKENIDSWRYSLGDLELF